MKIQRPMFGLTVHVALVISAVLCAMAAAALIAWAYFAESRVAVIGLAFAAGWFGRTARVHLEREPFHPALKIEREAARRAAERN